MPIFEYTCRACGERFEELVKSASAKPAGCPRCGSKRVEKEFSSFSAAVASTSPCASGACSMPEAGGCGGGCGSSGGCPFK